MMHAQEEVIEAQCVNCWEWEAVFDEGTRFYYCFNCGHEWSDVYDY